MIQAVLFDLDGTLTDTFELWYKSVREILVKHTGNELTREEYRKKYWGMDSRSKIRMLITRDESKVAEIYAELQDILVRNVSLVRVFPGVTEVLQKFSEKYKLAVITNSSLKFLEAQLSETGIGKYFSVKVADAMPKPNPEGLLRACRDLNVSQYECVFLGDSRFDIDAGKNAGIKTLIVGREIGKIGDVSNLGILR